MKPTSIIFLIFSVIILVVGMIVCNVATKLADKQGVVLFEQTTLENGDTVIKKEIPNDKFTKLELEIKDAPVNIFGGAESSYVELVNFDVNSYGISDLNNTLSIDDSFNITSLFKSTGGAQFKGLRYVVFDRKEKKGSEKSVNIYLSDNTDLKNISIKLGKGSVYVKSVSKALDYSLVTEQGNVTLDEVKNATLAKIRTGSGTVALNYSTGTLFDVDIASGQFNVINHNSDQISYAVGVSTGIVRYNGEDKGSRFESVSGDPLTTINARIGEGQAMINDLEK